MILFGMAIFSSCLRKNVSLLCGVWRKLRPFFVGLSSTRQMVKDDKMILYEDWKECIVPLIDSEPLKLNPNDFGFEQYVAAKTLVASRAFQIDEYHGCGMVPLADLFNHKTAAENVHFTSGSSDSGSDNDKDDVNEDEYENIGDDKPLNEGLSTSHLNSKKSTHLTATPGKNSFDDDDKEFSLYSGDDPPALELIIVKDVKAGAEVFNTYGSLGNSALLHRYGFTEPDNPFDVVNIDLDLVIQWSSSSFSGRYTRARLSLWRRLCDTQNSEYFEISSDGKPQLGLLILLYIFSLPDEAYQKLSCKIFSVGDFDKNLSILFSTESTKEIFSETQEKMVDLLLTKSVCAALIYLADIRESLYGMNSMNDDIKALRNCSCVQERKLYYSLVLRVSERRILKKLRIYATGSCSNKRKRRRN
ncbi:SET domain-containing protein isoform X2 [Tasmannia lanceolata]|uniref:SET domain-containing protein isoform X2 n=1 Tax=Tasmannia lanceolata TaxID=3420 RepID=UPI004062EC8A